MASNKEKDQREISDDLRHELFRALNEHPNINQRELASQLGVSLGKVNYCLQALIAKGWVKARNFKNSKNKLAYAYFLTPTGIEEKARLTFRYLKRKLKEHDELVRVIDELKDEVRSRGREAVEDSEELWSELDRFDASFGRTNSAG